MKSFIVFILCLIFLISCSNNTDTNLPEGYKLMCSTDGKKYSLLISGYSTTFLSPSVWDTAEEAKEFAWIFEDLKNRKRVYESSKYTWNKCE